MIRSGRGHTPPSRLALRRPACSEPLVYCLTRDRELADGARRAADRRPGLLLQRRRPAAPGGRAAVRPRWWSSTPAPSAPSSATPGLGPVVAFVRERAAEARIAVRPGPGADWLVGAEAGVGVVILPGGGAAPARRRWLPSAADGQPGSVGVADLAVGRKVHAPGSVRPSPAASSGMRPGPGHRSAATVPKRRESVLLAESPRRATRPSSTAATRFTSSRVGSRGSGATTTSPDPRRAAAVGPGLDQQPVPRLQGGGHRAAADLDRVEVAERRQPSESQRDRGGGQRRPRRQPTIRRGRIGAEAVTGSGSSRHRRWRSTSRRCRRSWSAACCASSTSSEPLTVDACLAAIQNVSCRSGNCSTWFGLK